MEIIVREDSTPGSTGPTAEATGASRARSGHTAPTGDATGGGRRGDIHDWILGE